MRDPIIALLSENPLLRACSKDELRTIGRTADLVRVSAGTVVSSDNQRDNPVILVSSGALHVVDEAGVTTLDAGSLCGAAEVLAGLPRRSHVVAATDAELFLIEPRRLRSLMERCPMLADRVLRLLALGACAAAQDRRNAERNSADIDPAASRSPSSSVRSPDRNIAA